MIEIRGTHATLRFRDRRDRSARPSRACAILHRLAAAEAHAERNGPRVRPEARARENPVDTLPYRAEPEAIAR